MSNPTANFGWVMPTSSDLVTDLPADFAVFGQGGDTTVAELKGGTTGQVLSKTSNTDMDFTWVTQDDANAIQNTIVDAKGDLIGATAADTPARLAVGTDGQLLQADSTAATGLKWATVAGGFTSYTDYTPTFTSFTLGNGTINYSRYSSSGSAVHYYGKVTLGSTSSISGAWEITLPLNCVSSGLGYAGNASFFDTSAGNIFVGWLNLGVGGAAAFRPRYLNTTYASDLGASAPFTWATGDALYWNVIYQKA